MVALERLLATLRDLGIAARGGLRWAGQHFAAVFARGFSAARQLYHRLKGKWWVAGIVAGGGIFVGIVANWDAVSGALCQVGGIHEICRQRGWGRVATPDQEARYQTAMRNGCPGLREYLRTESPDSPLFPSARQRWDTRWRRIMRDEILVRPMAVEATSDTGSSHAAALAQLADVTRAQAGEECGRYSQIPGYSLQSVAVVPGVPRCDSLAPGWNCSAQSRVQCRIRRRRPIDVEQC